MCFSSVAIDALLEACTWYLIVYMVFYLGGKHGLALAHAARIHREYVQIIGKTYSTV